MGDGKVVVIQRRRNEAPSQLEIIYSGPPIHDDQAKVKKVYGDKPRNYMYDIIIANREGDNVKVSTVENMRYDDIICPLPPGAAVKFPLTDELKELFS